MTKRRFRRLCLLLLIGILCQSALPQSSNPQARAAESAIRLNQVGYPPSFPKRATIPDNATTPLSWQLIDREGNVAASGRTTVFGKDAASGEHLHIADFSAYTKPGTGYTLRIGTASSHPFWTVGTLSEVVGNSGLIGLAST